MILAQLGHLRDGGFGVIAPASKREPSSFAWEAQNCDDATVWRISRLFVCEPWSFGSV